MYWIRGLSHTDMFTQGYIGVTSNIKQRIYEHNRQLENGGGHKYHRDLKKSFKEVDLYLEVIDCGSRSSMLKKEFELRPVMNTGWNVAVGGQLNGVMCNFKNGSSNDRTKYKRFLTLLKTSLGNGLFVDENFKNDEGFRLFCLLVDSGEDQCSYTSYRLIDDNVGMCLGNIEKVPLHKHLNVFDYNGDTYTVKQACDKNGVDIKLALRRLSQGYSVYQSVGFLDIIPRNYSLITICGKEYLFSNKWSVDKETFIEMIFLYWSKPKHVKKLISNYGVSYSKFVKFLNRNDLKDCKDRLDLLGVDYE